MHQDNAKGMKNQSTLFQVYASTQNKQDKVRMAFCGSKMILVVILEPFPIAMKKEAYSTVHQYSPCLEHTE